MSPTGDPLTAVGLGPALMILLPLHFTWSTLTPNMTTTESQTQMALPNLPGVRQKTRVNCPFPPPHPTATPSSQPTPTSSENTPPPVAYVATPAPDGQIQEKDLFKLFPAYILLQTLLLIKAAPQSFS